MATLKETLLDIVKAIVDNPDDITIVETETDDSITMTLSVSPDDMGMVIGRHGRIAKAIRTVIKAVATSNNITKRVNVDIR